MNIYAVVIPLYNGCAHMPLVMLIQSLQFSYFYQLSLLAALPPRLFQPSLVTVVCPVT